MKCRETKADDAGRPVRRPLPPESRSGGEVDMGDGSCQGEKQSVPRRYLEGNEGRTC